MRRLIWRIVLPCVVLIFGAYFALQTYLSSDHAVRQVAERIAATLGTQVGLGGLDAGTGNCAVTNLQIFEAGTTAIEPFLVIERAESDLTLMNLLRGESNPKQLTLTNAHLTLRHDKDGNLATKLPKSKPSNGPIPEFHLKNCTITIRVDGEPDCTFRGIDAQITSNQNALELNGKLTDPMWGGSWQLRGAMPATGNLGTLHLKNPGLHVTPSMLERVPYVSADVWQHVRLEGDTPVDVRMAFVQDHLKYRVELSPVNTSVFVSSINLTAQKASGSVVVEPKHVILKNVRGQVANGELRLPDADLDFRRPQTHMQFALAADKLNLHGLPPQWKLPPGLGGKLSGKADLTVQVVNGLAIPSGSGDGEVQDAIIGPIRFPSYGLRIQADKNGFRFEPRLGDKLLIPLLRGAVSP